MKRFSLSLFISKVFKEDDHLFSAWVCGYKRAKREESFTQNLSDSDWLSLLTYLANNHSNITIPINFKISLLDLKPHNLENNDMIQS